MKTIIGTDYASPDVLQLKKIEKTALNNDEISEAFAELKRGVYAALETYSNVHRGSGHNSVVTTLTMSHSRSETSSKA